eukprot:4099989-Lingulodinium_polyedra.AAC.1
MARGEENWNRLWLGPCALYAYATRHGGCLKDHRNPPGGMPSWVCLVWQLNAYIEPHLNYPRIQRTSV